MSSSPGTSTGPSSGAAQASFATSQSRQEEVKGLRRLGTGAGVGLAGGIVGVVFPIVFLWLTSHNPGGFLTYGTTLVDTTGFFILAGAILLLVSLFVYRRGFAVLRKVDGRFAVASVLCIIGSIGFLLILVSAAILVGSSSSLIQCLHQAPSHALTCIRSGQPLGADTGLVGFWLGWLGGLGIVVGLSMAGRRYHNGTVSGGAALYAILLLVLIGPFLSLLVSLPGIDYLLLIVPVFIVLAPGLVLGGTRRTLDSADS
ncbi:MAG: hypothetical protein WCB18_00435 [Thermoplasmata archaeon]